MMHFLQKFFSPINNASYDENYSLIDSYNACTSTIRRDAILLVKYTVVSIHDTLRTHITAHVHNILIYED